jgi:hypothetical protein
MSLNKLLISAMVFFSGGRPEASKRNLNFQSATWHHLKHLQIKDFFSQSIIICKLNPNHYHVIATVVAAAEDLVLLAHLMTLNCK